MGSPGMKEFRRHQIEAIGRAMDHPAFGLFTGVGTGKTRTALEIIRKRRVKRVLIAVPAKAILPVWESEIDKWGYHDYHCFILDGSKTQKIRQIEYAMSDEFDDKVCIIITTYNSVWKAPYAAMLRGWPEMIIADEAQAIKSAGSGVSKRFGLLGKETPYKIAITATPMHETPLDVYGIFRFLDKDIFGTHKDAFNAKYAEQVLRTQRVRSGPNRGKMIEFNEIVGYKNLEELTDKVRSISYMVESDDVLDLPEEIDIEVPVVLTKATKNMYNEMKKEYIVFLQGDDQVSKADNTGIRYLRLQQIANGFASTNLGNEVISNEKMEAAKSIVNSIPESEGPVVFFCQFKQDLIGVKQLAQSIGRSYGELSGERNDLDGHLLPDVGIFATQIQSGSAGVDFTRSCHAIYVSHFSLGTDTQSRGRLRRPGQERPVRYYHLLAKGTVDKTIWTAIKNKQDVNRAIYEELKRG